MTEQVLVALAVLVGAAAQRVTGLGLARRLVAGVVTLLRGLAQTLT